MHRTPSLAEASPSTKSLQMNNDHSVCLSVSVSVRCNLSSAVLRASHADVRSNTSVKAPERVEEEKKASDI